ncbi:hypothetical protein DLAC_08542 [Tieghemostelium lacteum]|uniref:Glycosyltransferase 2-like domain-containing protein n=1 Tax=Tieghemostelium lacteum TaxID=361077 RepID=A0A151Z7N2_TIELA|nr:hypothetical protein DLAC_08542 [Tieghemostelium lacteum]|eukprot:KYQ89972.1 hypothetical protein DLAC_08542 [Tieghemostelium lacteum]
MISIVLPIYIRNKDLQDVLLGYFKEALDSIVQQTYQDWQLIIIDDGSVDPLAIETVVNQSYKVLVEELKIKILHNEGNKGLVYSLNRGIESSSGEFIARMDADDISHPKRLEMQYQYMKSHPEIDILGCKISMFSGTDEGKVIQHPDSSLSNWSMFFNCCLVHPSVMIRRHSEKFIKPFKYSNKFNLIEDYASWLKMISKYNITTSNLQSSEPLLRLRKHGESVSIRNIQKQKEQTIRASLYYIRKLVKRLNVAVEEDILQENIMWILQFPSQSLNNDTVALVERSFKFLEVIEVIFQRLEGYDKQLIKESTSERMGEIIALLFSKFTSNPNNSNLWNIWIKRSPTSQIISLLSLTSLQGNPLFNNSNSSSKTICSANSNQYKKNGIRLVCFSKDRGFQLGEYLHSFYDNLEHSDNDGFQVEMNVIYTFSNEIFGNSYNRVIEEFRSLKDINCNFILESSFTTQLKDLVDGNTFKYILFAVDDILYYHKFNLNTYCQVLEKEKECLGFYMKMHSNITYCHTTDENIQIPSELVVHDNGTYQKWDRTKPDCKWDWNYPFDLCSTIYRSSDVDNIIKGIIKYYGIKSGISHPNRLETNGNKTIIQKTCYQHLKYCCSPTIPIMSVITINRVQDVFQNRVYEVDNDQWSLENLNQLLLDNKHLNQQEYHRNSSTFTSVHIGNFYLQIK